MRSEDISTLFSQYPYFRSDRENVIIHMNNTSDLHIEYELEDFQTLMHLRVELRS